MNNDAMGHIAHLLPAYAADTLDPAGTLQVRAHLADCVACQTELAAWQSIQNATNVVYTSAIPATDDVLSRAWLRIEAILADGRAIPATNDAPAPSVFTSSSDRQTKRLSLSSFARRTVELLAVAALITLVLIGSLFALGPGRSWRWNDLSAILPALSGMPLPAATVTNWTLLDYSAADLPSGSPRVVVDRWRLQPSTTDVVLPANEGAVIFTVGLGEITVHVGSTEHELGVGDVLDVTGQEFAFRATAGANAVAYIVYVTPEISGEGGQSHARIWLSGDHLRHAMDFVLGSSADNFPGGSARIVLEELTLPPGSTLPPQAAQPLVWTEVGSGELGLTLAGERLPFRWKPGTERTFRYGDYFPYLAPNTMMTMRNAGNTPLVLYRLSLLSPDAESLAPSASPTGTRLPP